MPSYDLCCERESQAEESCCTFRYPCIRRTLAAVMPSTGAAWGTRERARFQDEDSPGAGIHVQPCACCPLPVGPRSRARAELWFPQPPLQASSAGVLLPPNCLLPYVNFPQLMPPLVWSPRPQAATGGTCPAATSVKIESFKTICSLYSKIELSKCHACTCGQYWCPL